MSYFHSDTVGPGPPWHPDTRTADELLYGAPENLELHLLDLQSQAMVYPGPDYCVQPEARKPGAKAGVLPGVEVVGNIPQANLVQLAPSTDPGSVGQYPVWTRYLREWLGDVFSGTPQALTAHGVVEDPPAQTPVDVVASAVGVSRETVQYAAVAALICVAALLVRK